MRLLCTCLLACLLAVGNSVTYDITVVVNAEGKVTEVKPPANTEWGKKSAGPLLQYKKYDSGFALEVQDPKATHCNSWVNAPTINLWSTIGKGFLYLLVLLWVFLGVAIVADEFMAAIEVITSKQKDIVVYDTETQESKTLQIRVWNETIANLTLLALGSSAPEILLAVIGEVGAISAGTVPSELGASTIVGSAAFNLFMISAVCMISVPKGEKRDVKEVGVFYITAVSSVFAYFWMLILLKWSSPDIIDIWEAVVTLLMFPALVVWAWAQDNSYWCSKAVADSPDTEKQGVENLDDNAIMSGGLQRLDTTTIVTSGGEDLDSDATAARFLNKYVKDEKKSRMWWRTQGIKLMTGKKHAIAHLQRFQKKSFGDDEQKDAEDVPIKRNASFLQKLANTGKDSSFEFSCKRYSVREDSGHIQVAILRDGNTDNIHHIKYATADGTACGGKDYESNEGVLTFQKGESMKTIRIKIMEDDQVEDNENFFITLSGPTGDSVMLGANCVCEVVIIDVSDPGVLGFTKDQYDCPPTQKKLTIEVERTRGSDGDVAINWSTKPGTAEAGKHYTEVSGTLEFAPSEVTKEIEVELLQMNFSDNKQFIIVLEEVKGGAELGAAVCGVILTEDKQAAEFVGRVRSKISKVMSKVSLAKTSWRSKLMDAIQMDVDEGEEVSCVAYVLHVLSIFWKVLFALLVPPTNFCGGWLTFTMALICTGVITMLVGELAGMFGCMVGMSAFQTAITIVALGTSLPDTFASKLATIHSPIADAAIGNITGSNSVNVFLGLGLPWCIGAFYHAGVGTEGGYKVPSGNLALSVVMFCPLAILCLVSIIVRQKIGWGALGGKCAWPTAFIYFLFWATFLAICLEGSIKI